jgi:uncharacterized protein YegP (UPF0339 family)
MASFHVFAEGRHRYRWRLIDEDGQPLAQSTNAYRSADACARDAARFRVMVAAAAIGTGRHRFGTALPHTRGPLARTF